MPNGAAAMLEAMCTWSKLPWAWLKKAGDMAWSPPFCHDINRYLGTQDGARVVALLALAEGLTKPGERRMSTLRRLQTVGFNVRCYAISIVRHEKAPTRSSDRPPRSIGSSRSTTTRCRRRGLHDARGGLTLMTAREMRRYVLRRMLRALAIARRGPTIH